MATKAFTPIVYTAMVCPDCHYKFIGLSRKAAANAKKYHISAHPGHSATIIRSSREEYNNQIESWRVATC